MLVRVVRYIERILLVLRANDGHFFVGGILALVSSHDASVTWHGPALADAVS